MVLISDRLADIKQGPCNGPTAVHGHAQRIHNPTNHARADGEPRDGGIVPQLHRLPRPYRSMHERDVNGAIRHHVRHQPHTPATEHNQRMRSSGTEPYAGGGGGGSVERCEQRRAAGTGCTASPWLTLHDGPIRGNGGHDAVGRGREDSTSTAHVNARQSWLRNPAQARQSCAPIPA